MSSFGSFSSESLLEQGKSMAKKTGNAAMQGVKVTAQTAATQVTGDFGLVTDVASNIAHGDAPSQPSPPDEQFIRELYGAEHNQQTQPNQISQAPVPLQTASQPQAVDVEQQHQLAATRQKLATLVKQQHMESYFNPTFNRPQHQQVESVVEKNEREDEQKKFEDFEKQKKKPDFALQRAKTRTEMSPGASG